MKKEFKVIKADIISLLHDKQRQKFMIKEGILWIILLIISGIGFFGGLAALGFLGKHITRLIKYLLSKL